MDRIYSIVHLESPKEGASAFVAFSTNAWLPLAYICASLNLNIELAMKFKNLLTALCWAISLLTSAAQEGWTLLDPTIFGSRMDDVYFINQDTGWLTASPNIMKTTDGGQTWATQLTTNQNYLRCIEFLDDQVGFCGTLDGNFLKTTNGGETWMDIAPDIPGNAPGICGLSHVGMDYVYGCGIWSFPAYFVKSADGGNTWSYHDMSEHGEALIDPLFFHRDSGFVTGQDTSGGMILFTADGGDTWEEVHNTGVPGEYVWKIQMLTRDTLFASVENFGSIGTILVSHDGGKNWMTKTFPYSGNIQAIGFLDGSKGWVGGYFDGFHETLDGGETWQNIGIGNTLNRIFVLSPQLAYASGANVYKFTGPPPPSATRPPSPIRKDLDWRVMTSESGDHAKVQIQLARVDNLTLGLYSLEGRLLQMIYNGRLPAGMHDFEAALGHLPAGLYLIGLQINEGLSARKVSVH
jgi:photosystem II stability/assembly factor-like uncharacterized protein